MANMFVAKDGNDGNNGSSWALAKLTINAAITAAATNDTVQIGPGVYNEAVHMNPGAAKVLTLQGNGYVIIDGGGSLGDGVKLTQSVAGACTLTVNDLIIRGFTNGATFVATNAVTTMVLNRCRIFSCTTGVHDAGSTTSRSITLNYCLIHDCTTGINAGSTHANGAITITRCTIVDNTTGIAHTSVMTMTLSRCLFAKNGRHCNYSTVTNIGTHNYNLIWFDGTSDFNWNATVNTTLATWQAASSKDINSISEDPVFLDRLKKMYQPHVTSPMLGKLAELGVASGAGAMPTDTMGVIGMSKNDPDGNWAGRILSSTQVNGSDNIELSAGSSGTARSPVINLGSSRRIRRANIFTNLVTAMYPTDVPDYDTADVQPKKMTYRYRKSLTSFVNADVTPAWTEIEPSAFGVDLDTTAQYVQFEVTLRNDGT